MNRAYYWNKKIIISYILSIFVFWVHISTFANYDNNSEIVRLSSSIFCNTINKIAVPLFFVISGTNFYRDYTDKKYKYKIKSRIKSLIIPYVSWNTINMLFEIFASAFFSQYFIGREKYVFSIKNVFLGVFHYRYNGPLWFVFALIVFVIAAPLIDKLLYSQITSIITIVILLILLKFDIGLPQPLFHSKTCIIFYLFGGYIGRYHFKEFALPLRKGIQLAFLIVIIVAWILLTLKDYGLLTNTIDIAAETIVLVILSISFWYAFDLFIPTSIDNVQEFFKHSFWVFALHINVSAIITKLIYFVLPKYSYISLINFILTTLLTLITIEIICQTTKKYCPCAYTLLSGGRQ